MASGLRNLKNQPKRAQHKQQTRTPKTDERQRNTGERENTQHCPNVNDGVRKHPTKYPGNN